MNFGRLNDSFQLSHADVPLLYASSNIGVNVVRPMVCASNATFQSNVFVNVATVTRSLNASNVTITGLSNTNSNILTINNSNTQTLAQIAQNGVLNISTLTTIGTPTPAPLSILTVNSNMTINDPHSLYTGSIYTSIINDKAALSTSQIRFETINNRKTIILRCDAAIIQGDFDVRGAQIFSSAVRFTDVVVDTNFLTSNMTLVEDTPRTVPTFNMVYNGPTDEYTCNIHRILVRPNDSNITAFIMDDRGRIGLGRSNQQAILDMYTTPYTIPPYYMRVINSENSNACFVMDRYANTGIGTDYSPHKLFVAYDEGTPIPDSNALVKVSYSSWDSNIASTYKPLFVATSNNLEVFKVQNQGQLVIGGDLGGIADSNIALDVTSNLKSRVPVVEIHQMHGNPSDNFKIIGNGAQLLELSNVTTDLASISNLAASNIFADYIFTNSYENLGMSCVTGSVSLFTVKVRRFQFRGSNIIFSSSESDFATTDAAEEGKLRVMCDDVLGGVSRGISVEGSQVTSIAVESKNSVPFYELVANKSVTPRNGYIGLRNDGTIGMDHTSNVFTDATKKPMFCVYPTENTRFNGGACIELMKNTVFTEAGVYVNAQTIDTQRYLQVDGSIVINTNNTTSAREAVLTVLATAAQKRVGINTSSPTFGLDVYATTCLRENARVSGSVGICTTTDVATDIMHISTTTLSTTASNLLVLNNSNARGHSLFVRTPTSNVVINKDGNIGVGKTNPAFPLDVNGHINFAGYLYKEGNRYFESQFTTVPDTLGDVYISQNVGIGTVKPLYGLHVAGGKSIYCTSNITSDGTMYSKGSFITTSDQRVKTNLAAIPNPLEKVDELTGYTYWRTDIHKKEVGLVAQEVQAVLPELVHTDAATGMKSISYGNMAGLFVESIKQLRAEVQSLKREIAGLKTHIPTCTPRPH
jgi:hypothetical protein